MTIGILIGRDNLTIDGVDVTPDMAEGDMFTLAPEGDWNNATMTYGDKMIVAEDRQGHKFTGTMRVLRGSKTDNAFALKRAQYKADSPSYVCSSGSATQRIGDGDGNATEQVYNMQGIVFSRDPQSLTINTNGSTEQAVREYTFHCIVS